MQLTFKLYDKEPQFDKTKKITNQAHIICTLKTTQHKFNRFRKELATKGNFIDPKNFNIYGLAKDMSVNELTITTFIYTPIKDSFAKDLLTHLSSELIEALFQKLPHVYSVNPHFLDFKSFLYHAKPYQNAYIQIEKGHNLW